MDNMRGLSQADLDFWDCARNGVVRRSDQFKDREFGRGFGWPNLAQMRAFYLAGSGDQILQTPSAAMLE